MLGRSLQSVVSFVTKSTTRTPSTLRTPVASAIKRSSAVWQADGSNGLWFGPVSYDSSWKGVFGSINDLPNPNIINQRYQFRRFKVLRPVCLIHNPLFQYRLRRIITHRSGRKYFSFPDFSSFGWDNES